MRWFVDGTEPPASSAVITTLAREGALVRARLWNCAALPLGVDPVLSLAIVAGQVNPHLPRSEANRFWAAAAAAPCFGQLSAREGRWIDLFHASPTALPRGWRRWGLHCWPRKRI